MNNTRLIKEYVAQILNEKYAAGGFEYETLIQSILSKSGHGPEKATAGSSHGADAVFYGPVGDDGDEYSLEVKDSPNVFAGQKNCLYDGSELTWSTPDALTSLYDEINLQGIILDAFQDKLDEIMTILGVDRLPASMTNAQYWKVRNKNPSMSLELGSFKVSPAAIYKNYVNKGVYYIQIGSGYGFYYLDSNPAGLQVPQFRPANVSARARIKWGGSSAGVKSVPSSYDPQKAADPQVAQKRSSLSLNVGLNFTGLKPSTRNIEVDPSFLGIVAKSKS